MMLATAKRNGKELVMETSLATLKREKPEALLQRIVRLDKDIRYHEKKLKRSKNELYVAVYLYIRLNSKIVEDERGSSSRGEESLEGCETFKRIEDATGHQARTIRNWYHNGRLACKLDIDIVKTRPAALCALPCKIKPKDFKPIAKALNDGVNGRKMGELLEDLGYTARSLYARPDRALESNQVELKKRVQARYRRWADWKDELNYLAQRMSLTTDGPIHLELHCYVGEDALAPVVEAKVHRK